MSSYTYSQTFTLTHAKLLASKVATDLKRIQRFYNAPSDSDIQDYEDEITLLLKLGFLDEVTYGYKKNDEWVEPTIKYTAKELANSGTDDDPGKVRPGADINGASFYSYLTYSKAYHEASASEIERFQDDTPVKRSNADYPGIKGYFSNDKSYYSGGRSLDRSSLKSY